MFFFIIFAALWFSIKLQVYYIIRDIEESCQADWIKWNLEGYETISILYMDETRFKPMTLWLWAIFFTYVCILWIDKIYKGYFVIQLQQKYLRIKIT